MIRHSVRFLVCIAVLFCMAAVSAHAGEERRNSPGTAASGEASCVAGALHGTAEGGAVNLFLPLKKTAVRIEVTSGIAYAQVTQSFVNDTAYALEAVYVFPLPANATVTDMELHVGNRVIRSVVKEKQEAQHTYEAAKAEGRKAALVEEERPNIFTTSVANFRPGEAVEIMFRYLEPVAYRKGEYSLTFPMVVGPRYIPFTIDDSDPAGPVLTTPVADALRISPPVLHPSVDAGHRLSIDVELRGLPISELVSHTHPVVIRTPQPGDDAWHASLAERETVPNCDFNLQIRLDPDREPSLSFLNSSGDAAAYGLLTVFPPLDPAAAAAEPGPRDVVFLIDTSGSMDGTSILQAKAGLTLCLDMLRPADTFTIVRFASDFSWFSEFLRPADGDSIAQARAYVDRLAANGGTEMLPALKHVLSLPPRPGATKIIVFLTDGCVGNERDIIKLLGTSLRGERLFGFGIGSAPNEYIMRKITEVGRGQARFIRSPDDIAGVLADFFKSLNSPVLTDVAVEWLDASGKPSGSVVAYPNPLPDVFAEHPLQISATYPPDFAGTLAVSGTCGGRKVSYRYPVSREGAREHPAVEKLFGRSRIDDLMARMLYSESADETEELRNEVIRTAIRHQLVSSYTSRVAVEQIVDSRPDGTLVTVNVPIALPKGWNPAVFVPTATSDPALLLAGALALALAAWLWMRARRMPLCARQ